MLYGGLDVGGSNISMLTLSAAGDVVAQQKIGVPQDLSSFCDAVEGLVHAMDVAAGEAVSVGMCFPGPVFHEKGQVRPINLPFLFDVPLQEKLESRFQRPIRMANDADCLALAEAVDGAGVAFDTVLGLIMGTGIGGGYVCHGRLIEGANHFTGEIGQLPLPFATEADGDPTKGPHGMPRIEDYVAAPALARLYAAMAGAAKEPPEIAAAAQAGDGMAQAVLDRYYESFAKAMIAVIYSFDPEAIVLSGGLIALPGLFDEVPRRWTRYSYVKPLRTQFLRAQHGAQAGARGAAWLWREEMTTHIRRRSCG